MKELMLKKIKSLDLKIAVIGLGYVGLPLAVEKAKAGFRTIGFDILQDRVDMVNQGINYIGDVVEEDLKQLVENKMLTATNDFTCIKDVDFVAICVPTPLNSHQEPDISYVVNSAKSIAKYLRPETIVVLESTTYPGTTEEVLKPILEEGSDLICGTDFYLGFSPERVDPGNLIYKTKNTPKVVGAVGEDAAEVIATVYKTVLESDVHIVSSPAVGEMEKVLENIYRNVNIAVVNELAMLCEKMNIDIWEVIDAAKTKPYGFQAFYPGPGVGGHCIPLDPYYLSWKAKEYNFHTTLIEASMTINHKMPEYCVERMSKILNKFKKPLADSKILLLGVAYKGDISDYRESPALKVIEELEKHGSIVNYFDPYVESINLNSVEHKSVQELSVELLQCQDLVVITTAHSNIDYNFVQENSKFIFDTKNAMKHVLNRKNVERM
ncbi:nucleotide sugar dehydrogenase [Lysinibacillus fusiformis]|uniref:nucleotide sugar dehydrogenase n=1 Tax=Lysinibacillus fusiformis TaxID=28031 RepID=UPI00148DB3DD|nr:nucleotide sugar dehydrogenase [Lysinibacillus fusiformis]NOG29136.1 nucleotide sugar dehydrogenase [Lysinibacillus fusiformis]